MTNEDGFDTVLDLVQSAISAIKADIDVLFKMVEELKKMQKINN